MSRQIIDVPFSLCRMTGFDWDIDWRTQPAGENTAGTNGALSVGFPVWVGSLSAVLPGEFILQWRAVRAKARGRLGLYRIEIYDPLVPVPIAGQPWADGETWDGGGLWGGNSFWTFAVAAARGDTTIKVTVADPMPVPVAGQIISHEDWPTIVTSAVLEAGVWDLTISRPLVVAAAVDDHISIRPTGIFEAVNDTTGNPEYGPDRVSRPVLELREYLNR